MKTWMGFWSSWPLKTLAAHNAIVQAGREGEVLTVTGVVTSKDDVEAVQRGDITIIIGLPGVYYAHAAVAAVINILNGEPYEERDHSRGICVHG